MFGWAGWAEWVACTDACCVECVLVEREVPCNIAGKYQAYQMLLCECLLGAACCCVLLRAAACCCVLHVVRTLVKTELAQEMQRRATSLHQS